MFLNSRHFLFVDNFDGSVFLIQIIGNALRASHEDPAIAVLQLRLSVSP